MIKKIISGQINSITIAAGMVAFFSLASRLLGVFRDRILASEFGAGNTLDVYYAAFRIPDMIFNLLVLGALSAGFIPIFTSLLKSHKDGKEDNKEAWELAGNVLNLLVVGLAILAAVGIVFAPLIMRLITPGFSPEKMATTVSLTRIMFLSPIFLGVSSVLAGVLQSFKRFFIYSLAPIFYNLGIILGALFLVPVLGTYGLALGVVAGAALHMLIQLPWVIKLGYRFRWSFDWKEKNVRKIFQMMGPRTMSLAIDQINLVVLTIIASTLSSGSLAIFNLANNLESFPVGIFGISFAIAAFPTLSACAFDRENLRKNFSLTLRQILFFIIPSMVFMIALRAQIVRVILGAGNFTWQNTIMTMDAMAYFALGMFAQAITPLIVRAFYARHNSLTPFLLGLFTVTLNVVLSWYLPRINICEARMNSVGQLAQTCAPLGAPGLALAFALADIFEFIILWLLLRREVGGLDEKRVFISAVKIILAALAGGLAVQGMKLIVWPFIDMTTTIGVAVQGGAAALGGIAVFILFCILLRSEEYFSFWYSFKKRISWKKLEPEDTGEARGL